MVNFDNEENKKNDEEVSKENLNNNEEVKEDKVVEEQKNTSKEEDLKEESEDTKESESLPNGEDELDSKINGLLDEMKFKNSRIRFLEDENKRLKNEGETLKTRLLNLNSEYENYRNRTDKEKAELEDASIVKVLKDIVPIIDNLERALVAETDDLEGLKEGVNLTLTQFFGTFQKMGVEEIPTNEGFNPELHEAVMHENNPDMEKNQIGEVFLKGYKKGDKVIRHTVVKVIN